MKEIDLTQAAQILEQHEKNANINAFKHIKYEEKMRKSFDELI